MSCTYDLPDDFFDDPLIAPSYEDLCSEVESFEEYLQLSHAEAYPDTGYSFQNLIDDFEVGA